MWKRAAITTTAGLAAATAFAAPAHAVIEVDHGIEFVSLSGMPGGNLRLTVTDPLGNALAVKRFSGDIELNHDAPPCFEGTSTPDLRPGDTLTVSEDVDGGVALESYTIEDVTYASRFDAANPGDPLAVPPVPATPATLVISGSLPPGSAAGAEVRLGGTFGDNVAVTGGTLNQNRGNRLLITPAADAFTVRISPVVEADVAEIVVSAGAAGGNITMFSGDAGFAPPGCPALDASRGPITLPALPPAPVPPGDADNDTVTNDVDKCPNTAGPVNNDGCPLPAPRTVVVERNVVQSVPVAGATGAAGTTGTSGTAAQPATTGGAQAVKAVQSQSLAVSGLSLSQRISVARLRAQGLRLSMRVPSGAKVVRVAVYRARGGKATGKALFSSHHLVSRAGQLRATITNRSSLRKLRAGQYIAEVRAGTSRSTLGSAARRSFRVTG